MILLTFFLLMWSYELMRLCELQKKKYEKCLKIFQIWFRSWKMMHSKAVCNSTCVWITVDDFIKQKKNKNSFWCRFHEQTDRVRLHHKLETNFLHVLQKKKIEHKSANMKNIIICSILRGSSTVIRQNKALIVCFFVFFFILSFII